MSGTEGQGLGVVSGTTSHHSLAGAIAEHGEFIHDSANLECSSALEVLGFQHD
jgi:hypothetical protein